MKVILFISIFCVSIGAAFAADLKVGDKCVTSSGAAGTVGVKYTEKGEAVGLKCIENAAVKAHEPAVLTADKQARRADGIGDYQFPKSTCLTQCTKNGKVDEHCFRMCGKMGRPNEKPAASIGQGKAIDGKPFKFEILPSDKCVLQKLPEVDPQLKCIKLKSTAPVGPARWTSREWSRRRRGEGEPLRGQLPGGGMRGPLAVRHDDRPAAADLVQELLGERRLAPEQRQHRHDAAGAEDEARARTASSGGAARAGSGSRRGAQAACRPPRGC